MIVNEIFDSINGEVCLAHQGSLTTFVRFAGCNIVCPWCDTMKAHHADNGVFMSPESVADVVVANGLGRVTLTGGEPLLQPQLPELIYHLTRRAIRISIETNGTLSLNAIAPVMTDNVSVVMDVKLPSSDHFCDLNRDNFKRLRTTDFVKFVVADKNDFIVAIRLMLSHAEDFARPRIAFAPVSGILDPLTLSKWMLQERLDAILNIQIHKLIGTR